jgi:hypothetical protein
LWYYRKFSLRLKITGLPIVAKSSRRHNASKLASISDPC